MSKIIATLYAVMDKRPLRALSFVMALLLAGCMFWDPSRFAAKTSELEIWHGLLLMWAVCAGVIHGVGFRPQKVLWQGLRHMAAPCIISSYVGFISLITYERYSWLKARFILFLPPVARVNPA